MNTYTTGDQVLADVVAEPGGDLMVVSESEGSDASDSAGFSIRAQRFE